jgi:hypothetical protein
VGTQKVPTQHFSGGNWSPLTRSQGVSSSNPRTEISRLRDTVHIFESRCAPGWLVLIQTLHPDHMGLLPPPPPVKYLCIFFWRQYACPHPRPHKFLLSFLQHIISTPPTPPLSSPKFISTFPPACWAKLHKFLPVSDVRALNVTYFRLSRVPSLRWVMNVDKPRLTPCLSQAIYFNRMCLRYPQISLYVSVITGVASLGLIFSCPTCFKLIFQALYLCKHV